MTNSTNTIGKHRLRVGAQPTRVHLTTELEAAIRERISEHSELGEKARDAEGQTYYQASVEALEWVLQQAYTLD